MKITYTQVLNGDAALNQLLELELRPQVAIRLIRASKKLKEEIKNFEDGRQRILDKNEITDNDSLMQKTEEEKEAFNKEMLELLASEVDLPLEPMPVADLHVDKIKGSTLGQLEWFFNYGD